MNEQDPNQQNPPTPPQYQQQGGQQQGQQAPPRQQWDSTVNTRAIGLVVTVVALVAVIGLGFTMCSRVATGPGLGNSYGVLERRVDQAFESSNEQSTVSGGSRATQSELDSAATPPLGTPGAQPTDAEAQQIEDIEQQRQIMQQQEELRDQQREAVPSILPENPPTPVPLGGKY